MFFNFFTGSKELFLMPAAIIAAVHMIVTRRLRMWWIVAAFFVLTVLYPITRAYRDYAWEWGHNLTAVQVIANPGRVLNELAGVASNAFSLEYVQSGMLVTVGRIDTLGMLSTVVRDAGTVVPFQHGRTLAFIPMSFVPRLLWPGKPIFETAQWITDNFGAGPHIRSATASTWMGELFFNFGWSGLLIGMGLIGIYFRFLQDYFLRLDATIPALLAGVVTIFTLAVTLEADLVPATSGLMFRLAPIVLTHMVVSVIMPPPAKAPPPL
jgi:hypothetical protein